MKPKGKVVIFGTINLLSPAILGCGRSENTDVDILKDNEGYPFIPATSFLGVLGSGLRSYKNAAYLNKYWGDAEHSSNIKCSDLHIKKESSSSQYDMGGSYIESRDGIKIDNKTGIAEDMAKYDFETIKRGTEFCLDKMELDVEFDADGKLFNDDSNILISIISLLSGGLCIGAKTAIGFGKARLFDYSVYEFNFKNKKDILFWLKQDFSKAEKKEIQLIDNIDVGESYFILDFNLKRSLIIRSYSNNPYDPDSVHIKSNGKNVIAGTSIKGALRARAERILNTIYDNEDDVRYTLLSLFGGAVDGNRQMPSRLSVNEVDIDNATEWIQHRTKIDRFSGGTIESALFDSCPVFAEKKDHHVKEFKISIKNAKDSDVGLMLLITKDLWTGDLPIGGEKGIGRGVLEGLSATIKHNDFRLIFDSMNMQEMDRGDAEILNSYVKSLVNKKYINDYKSRCDSFIKDSL